VPLATTCELVEETNALAPRQRRELDVIRRLGRCSRVELHERLGLRKATVTEDTARLLELGLIREGASDLPTNGRPRQPLEIDRDRLTTIGVAIDPWSVRVQQVDLLGEPVGRELQRSVRGPQRLIRQTRQFIDALIDEKTLAVGVTVPGFVEPASNRVLFSVNWPEAGPVELAPLAEMIAPRRFVLENLTNGLAKRLQFQRPELVPQDKLVIYFADGMLGSSLLVRGRPIDGCIMACNELGHTRLPVHTPECYCGHTGCLERIFSSEFIAEHTGRHADLAQTLRDQPDHEAVKTLHTWLAIGLANAVNFCRVGRVVFATDLRGAENFFHELADAVQSQLLHELRDRVSFSIVTRANPSGPRRSSARIDPFGWGSSP